MSYMELNKGVLRPTGIDTENYTDENFEDLWDNGMTMIDGEVYSIEYEVEGKNPDEGFAEVVENEDGSISFFTCHYNGGAGLEEVIEGYLNGEEI